MTTLVLDCYGGDNSPLAHVKGAVRALSENPELFLILTGREEEIKALLEGTDKTILERIEVVNAPDVIGCDEKPTDAIRLKRESSMMKAVKLLREDDKVDGMVSTGSTGALVAAATLRIGRLNGVIRPAFCPILPTMNGSVVGICDSGANVECTPEYLEQFAVMGSIYMECVYGFEKPRVALLNVGTESEKGDTLHTEAYARISALKDVCFVGNMESRDLLSGKYSLVVCDGFSGNVLVKATEGTALELLKKIKKDINKSFRNKIGALFMRRMFMEEKEFMNYQNYGGSVLLGCAKIVVKGHGSSNEVAVAKCIEQAYKMSAGAINEKIERALSALGYGR